jgi:hypothetical protein
VVGFTFKHINRPGIYIFQFFTNHLSHSGSPFRLFAFLLLSGKETHIYFASASLMHCLKIGVIPLARADGYAALSLPVPFLSSLK